MIRYLFIAFIFFASTTSFSQEKKRRPLSGFYDRYPWEGQAGIKTNFNLYKAWGIEAGVLLSDIPKKTDEDYQKYFGGEGWCVANQNLFLTSEYNSDFQLALKAGYEINYIILGGRVSYMHYFDIGENRSAGLFLPEAGLSVFGFFNIFYGYTFTKVDWLKENGLHRISLGINWVYFK